MTDDRSPDEILDWLCWVWATEAERFYPPEESAEECIEQWDVDDVDERSRGEEYGYHTAMFWTAQTRFEDLRTFGLNPKERAKREIERSREQGFELEDIDWSWLGDDDEQ